MSFYHLFIREWKWLLKSPGQWVSLPVLIVLASLYPILLPDTLGWDIPYFEETWVKTSDMWNGMLKGFVEENKLLGFLFSQQIILINEALSLKALDIWRMFLIPAYQFWGLIPLAALLGPFAVGIFNRDRNFYMLHRMNGGQTLTYLCSKTAFLLIFITLLQGLSYLSFMVYLRHFSHHPDLISFWSPMWLSSWMVGGVSLGLFTCVLSWLFALLSRNGSTEFYSSILVGALVLIPLSLFFRSYEFTLGNIYLFSFYCLGSSVLLVAALRLLIRRQGFFIH